MIAVSIVLNLYNKQTKGRYWFLLLIDKHTAVYFHSFGIEHIPQEVLRKIKSKSIKHKISRIQDV